jgi:hypothetical protein
MKRALMLGLWLLCLLCNLVAALQMLVAIVTGSRRAWTLAVSYDQLGNVVLGGDEDTTISARAWANRATWRWSLLVRLLDKVEPRHCYKAWLAEMGKARRYWTGA